MKRPSIKYKKQLDLNLEKAEGKVEHLHIQLMLAVNAGRDWMPIHEELTVARVDVYTAKSRIQFYARTNEGLDPIYINTNLFSKAV